MKQWPITIVLVVAAYLAGYFLSPHKIKTETKTVEVEKIVTKVVKQKVRIKENKDGSKETVIITDTKSDEKTDIDSKESNKEVTNGSRLNISVLAGSSFPLNWTFGVSATRQVLGPITFGAWGLSNGTFGLSAGLNF